MEGRGGEGTAEIVVASMGTVLSSLRSGRGQLRSTRSALCLGVGRRKDGEIGELIGGAPIGGEAMKNEGTENQ